MKIKFSIVIVSFNRVKVLEQAISSVVNQTYKNFELIVIDGGSTDGTVEILKKYDEKIAYWVSEKDNGIYHAMNKAVAHATGDYIEFLGSDDCFCSENVLQNVADEMKNDTDIFSGCTWFVYEGQQFPYKNDFAREKKNYSGGMIPHAGMFSKLELLKRFPFDESYKIAGDYKFFLQCYFDEKIKFQFSDTMIAFFEMNGASTNFQKSEEEMNRLHRELNLQLGFGGNFLKCFVRKILNATGLRGIVRHVLNKYIRGKKHHCENKICRWCGRGVNAHEK